ncbi:MAG: outer membrane beta-barrel protein [Maribacter dokdonensis]|uniref:Outer membrane protein beta-barrel domain-containing protein n=1 Tax=Maribacter dokdonensis TaxID=320912 RepID=A0A1H4SHV8_9FLAO|nr:MULTISPECIES: outer membrane beta-barrel protein [Maribacter]MBU2902672.1 porin family protein [Maribacter dokdonensis]SEC43411.1 Outer membrane protein beta-barrel domain-containing protein [Maribacter dokdonensis]
MKYKMLIAVLAIFSTTAYGQWQVSASSGYAVGSAGMKLGERITTTETENSYGSYGEGTNFQLRGTYFFDDSFGFDLGVGYLHGADQDISVVSLPDTEVNAVARARAFGASASVVYKFTNNIYGRFGALLKLGGKTEGVIYQKSVFSEAEAEAFGVPEGSYSETNYKEDFHGHFPLGFVGALGYKYDLDDNFSLFVEAEYYGISLKRKDSEISEFNTDVKLPDGTVAVSGLYTIDNLPEGVNRTTTYVDNLSNTNTDTSKELSQKVPYSSFGLNIGITYKFNKATN